ncbi:MAG: class I adenylate-forming enzyme family protein [Betaproteobacteria bacterium]
MVISAIIQQARQTPGKTAVVYNGVICSFTDFARRIDVAREYFAQWHLPRESVAVIDVENLADGWVFLLALRGLGVTTLAVREAEDIGKSGIRNIGCVVTSSAEQRTLPSRLGVDVARVIRVPGSIGCADTQPAVLEIHDRTAHPGSHIMMTSGTTGAYKKILRDASVEAMAIPLHAEINAISVESVVYIANFGPWTAGGYRWPLITWSMGGTVIIHDQPDMHAPLLQHDVTHIFATPGTLGVLLGASNGALRRNDATRLLVTGGAMSQAMLAAAKRGVTRQVFSVLASTEALTLAVTPLDSPDDLHWHRIHPSREVQVVDEADNVLGRGREGLVRVRIIDGLAGYLDDEPATRAYFRDGYFYPGDIGLFGVDGRLSLRGRASDVINVLGDKIAVGPIEQALQDRLGAQGVCVLSMTTMDAGDEIVVVIQPHRPLEPAAIQVAVNAELGMVKRIPVRAVVIAKLPRNEMGKIERLVLRRQLILASEGRLAGP